MKLFLPVLALGVVLVAGCATSRNTPAELTSDDARGYFEVLRSDFNAEKVRTLNRVMKLTASEADKFWPIYRSYEKELAVVGDRKLALIREFLAHHKAGTLDDRNSRALAEAWLANVRDRLNLWAQYHRQISEAVSPVRAALFLQVENQLAIFVDLSIASQMPVVGSSPVRP